ncbi:MAG: thioredoxin family protein [Candidatus Sumerlaeota bacterium]
MGKNATREDNSVGASKGKELAGSREDPQAPANKQLPKMVDLGAGKCIPCKMMEPILDELREEYQGKFDVVFIDVWEKSVGWRKVWHPRNNHTDFL